MTMPVCVVLVTCGSLAEAERIAEAVVTERLAACVNVLGGGSPVRSFYVWEGALQRDEEILLIMKTREAAVPTLEARIKALHGYSTPEFIVVPVMAGSSEYLGWVVQNTDFS